MTGTSHLTGTGNLIRFFFLYNGKKELDLQRKSIVMARKARIHSNIGIYHVMLRGINRQDLFHEESDYLFFLKRLRLLAHPQNEKNESASPLRINFPVPSMLQSK